MVCSVPNLTGSFGSCAQDIVASDFNKDSVFWYIEKEDAVSWQVQATWFMLSGEIGREISDRWLESCLIDISMVDDSTRDEREDFVENRYDQSLLSCVVKSMKIKPSRLRPCFRPLTFTSTVRCYLHPVWSARNRTGVSIQRKEMRSV